MTRTFAYARVSKGDLNNANQLNEITNAGFLVEPHRIITEIISGSTAASSRSGFSRLLDKMEKGDVLVVTKLDRLGRNAIDVGSTVAKLEEIGIKVHCLALGGMDLTSSAGKMTMGVINSVAQFERDLIVERTNSGLDRARKDGKTLGRPRVFSGEQIQRIQKHLSEKVSVSAIARLLNTSRQNIMRVRKYNIPCS